MKTKKFPSSPIVKGTITMLHGDTCWVELEENLGIGILHQEQSLARHKSEPLEKLDNYTIGKRMTVYITHLQNSHKNQYFWYVNERWASNNPWADLKIKNNDEVIGTIVRTAKIGYFVQLDNPDIEVFLPQNQVPWSDGSLGEEPNEANISRLPLAVDDRIKAIVTEIHYPPSNPVISLSQYLAYQARSDQILETKQTFQIPLQYNAHIKGWAFSLLIQTKLEHHFLNECLNRQLPFFIQGQLLSGLTHEIRNRFSPWVNYQQTLREYWQQYKLSEADERQALEFEIEKALDGMETAYDRLDELMDLMLGGLRQSGVTTSIKTLLEQIKQLFTTQLRQHGIVLHIKPAPDITLGFSPLYLLQSLSNLILNTRKHMHRHTGGKVEIITKIEEISLYNNTQTVLSIYVADNGPGIPSYFASKIFTPSFNQAVKPEEHIGIGLYISRLLLQQIGGNMELIENWRGIGCVFCLQLPLSIDTGD
jgi:signal transduction histidine kinase